jgi:hypothetical protein
MKIKSVILGGIIAGIIIEIVSLAVSWVIQTIGKYNVIELPGMRSVNDPFSLLFFVYPWVLGFALSIIFGAVQKSFEGPTRSTGWKFGLLMWGAVSVPSAFLVFSSMSYPLAFTINSLLGSFIYMLLVGFVLAKLFTWMK